MSSYYPPVGFYFKIDFIGVGNGDTDAMFQQVTGLSAEISVEELQVGGENKFTYRLPVRAKYGNLVLKRGLLKDSGLISWFKDAIEDFIFKPVEVHVTLMNENGDSLSNWEFKQAYPVKWIISDFKSQENALVIETIELVYQYFQRR